MNSTSDFRHTENDAGPCRTILLTPPEEAPIVGAAVDVTAIVQDLDALKDAEANDRQATLERKYERLGQAYAHGLWLREDAVLREQFYEAEHWGDFKGRKPRLDRDGRDRAMHFAVMRVFGGTDEGRQEASLLARAATYLAELGVPAEDFVEELQTRPGANDRFGPRALVNMAREEKRQAQQADRGEQASWSAP